MKTPIQELIDLTQKTRSLAETRAQKFLVDIIIANMKKSLEKEKQAIINAYEAALIKMGTATNERKYAEKYYEEKYK